MMKNVLRYLAAAMFAAFAACSDPVDQPVEMEPVLSADKTLVYADGLDKARFTVTYDEEDVTARSKILVDGVTMKGNLFSASAPGKYVFKAVYNGRESNAVTVEAKPVESMESRFVKNVAVFEFTGAWCTFCPSGYSNMNFVISRNDEYKETVHIMAFHSGQSGTDALAIPETDRIMSDLGVGDGFPSFITELRTSGGLSDGNAFKASLTEAFEDNPAHCAVALASEINDGKVKVTARLHSELSSSYRIAVFVVEDNVKYYQKDGSMTYDEYNHRHVVRKVVSSSYMGDRLGDVPAVEVVSKDYEFEADASWKTDNTFIYALAIDYKGYVNNMCICPVNGNVDFNRI